MDRTHCSKGHPFDAANTLWRTDSSPQARRCRECKRERYRAYYERRGRALRGYQPAPADDPRLSAGIMNPAQVAELLQR